MLSGFLKKIPITTGKNKYLLVALLCAVLIQTSFLHQSKHNFLPENPCLSCLNQADLGSGQLPEPLQFGFLLAAMETFIAAPQILSTLSISQHRNRSPPL
jgi:hypothetical protein